MNTLVSQARAFNTLVARREFALCLTTGVGTTWRPMNLDGSMTVQDLKGIASASTGVSKNKLRMTHLNTELVCGTLGSNGVMPGSCIIVSEVRR